MTQAIGPNSYKTSDYEAPVLKFAQYLTRSESSNSGKSELFTDTTSDSYDRLLIRFWLRIR
jgi:hypothetical protein